MSPCLIIITLQIQIINSFSRTWWTEKWQPTPFFLFSVISPYFLLSNCESCLKKSCRTLIKQTLKLKTKAFWHSPRFLKKKWCYYFYKGVTKIFCNIWVNFLKSDRICLKKSPDNCGERKSGSLTFLTHLMNVKIGFLSHTVSMPRDTIKMFIINIWRCP